MPETQEDVVSQAVVDFASVVAEAALETSNIAAMIDAQEARNASEGAQVSSASGVTTRGQTSTTRGGSKIRSKIPWFTGDHPTYTWESFLLALEISELNEVYTDAERKQSMLQNLDGSARMFLMANKYLIHRSYPEIKAAFAKRFASKKSRSLTQLRAMTMTPDEKVVRWYARIMAVGDNIVAADTVGVSDVVKLAEIQGSRDTLDLLLMDQFKKGLRPEIRAQMKAETFANLEACAKAAEEAEEFLAATTLQSNHVEVEAAETYVHFASAEKSAVGQVQGMNNRAPVGGAGAGQAKKGQDKEWVKKATCYNCDKRGHLANRCPEPRRPKEGQKNKWGNKGNKGKDGKNSEKKNTVETNNIVVDQLAKISERLEQLCSSGRRSRSTSRSRKHGRRHSSSRNSRSSSSKSRSNSRRRNKVSYATSSKN